MTATPALKVVTLYPSNRRNAVQAIREIANDIEAGTYGEVGSVGVVVLGDTMECFGAGEDSEAPSIALLFHAAFMRLSGAVEKHGRE